MKLDLDVEVSVEVVRDPGWWRSYRLVLVMRYGRQGDAYRSGIYGRYWSRSGAEYKAREVLSDLAAEPAQPQVVATVRPLVKELTK